ncbi:MAG: hypothetical protein KKF30_11060 [Proteobacteria bacterium]|nr:hypothetical protein [Pseudomonadota bacterium]MBU4469019.1 hypothetical protein [Pseudomonadota bacterium]MCG2750958.1 hypothetical protein [Desulfobacteraceae bacterium]
MKSKIVFIIALLVIQTCCSEQTDSVVSAKTNSNEAEQKTSVVSTGIAQQYFIANIYKADVKPIGNRPLSSFTHSELQSLPIAKRRRYDVIVSSSIRSEDIKPTMISVVENETRKDDDIDGITVNLYDSENDIGKGFTLGHLEWCPNGRMSYITADIALTNNRATYEYDIIISKPSSIDYQIHQAFEKAIKANPGKSEEIVAEEIADDFKLPSYEVKGRYYNVLSYIADRKQSVQPIAVKEIIGINGENLTGKLVTKDELGTTVSQQTEFTIGAAPDEAQVERKKQTELATAELKKQLCIYLEQLLSFKDDPIFKRFGFAIGGPYNHWLTSVEEMQAAQSKGSNPIPLDLRAMPGYLWMLGMDYMTLATGSDQTAMRELDTRYIRRMLPEIKDAIDFHSYIQNKNR